MATMSALEIKEQNGVEKVVVNELVKEVPEDDQQGFDALEALRTKAGITDLLSRIASLEITVGPETDFPFIGSIDVIGAVVDTLLDLPKSPPSLYIDLEGINLSRQGSISILQIFVAPLSRTYLIDVHTLGAKVFSITGSSGSSLKNVLESPVIPKVFFDVRNDSDALFSHFGIKLAGVQDLQLMELATRTRPKKFVSGLAKCIEYDAPMTKVEKLHWMEGKEEGRKLFAPECGGSFAVFNERPLALAIQQYCVQDVQFLPKLWNLYNSRMTARWGAKVGAETLERVRDSQSATYHGHGREMARGPW